MLHKNFTIAPKFFFTILGLYHFLEKFLLQSKTSNGFGISSHDIIKSTIRSSEGKKKYLKNPIIYVFKILMQSNFSFLQ